MSANAPVIVAASVGATPTKEAYFASLELPAVNVIFSDGRRCRLFDFYPDEIQFCAREFLGRTESQAHELRLSKDRDWLRGTTTNQPHVDFEQILHELRGEMNARWEADARGFLTERLEVAGGDLQRMGEALEPLYPGVMALISRLQMEGGEMNFPDEAAMTLLEDELQAIFNPEHRADEHSSLGL